MRSDSQSAPVPSHPLKYLSRRILIKRTQQKIKEDKITQIQRLLRKRGSKKSEFISQINPFFKKKKQTHGSINDISLLDPLPGLVGLIKVVSTRVQPSPLNPQLPGG